LERLTGVEASRILVDKSYRGYPYKFWISGSPHYRRHPARKRRAASEPVIDLIEAEHRINRNYLKGRDGDRINAALSPPATTLACSYAGYATSRPAPAANPPMTER
jgi:transposase, IS5 family